MFGTIFAINLCNIHSNNVLVQLKQKQKIFRKNFNNRYEYKDISTTYVHLVDICHKLNLNFFFVCVCVCEKKEVRSLGNFSYILAIFQAKCLVLLLLSLSLFHCVFSANIQREIGLQDTVGLDASVLYCGHKISPSRSQISPGASVLL